MSTYLAQAAHWFPTFRVVTPSSLLAARPHSNESGSSSNKRLDFQEHSPPSSSPKTTIPAGHAVDTGGPVTKCAPQQYTTTIETTTLILHSQEIHTEKTSPTMVHLSKPGRDLGYFCTDEVRPRTEPTSITGRTIAFPKNHYKEPPNVAGGFKMLDLSHEGPAVRANLVGSDISTENFHITLETWDGGILYGASAQWIEHKSGSKECHFGQFDTRDVKRKDNGSQEYKKRFKFPRTFRGGENPSVICWLNRLDMANGDEMNWRINAYAADVTPQGATFHIDTWGDSVLNGAAMCWIAFPQGKKKVDCGNFSTGEVRPWHEAKSRNSKRVRFKEGWFQSPPTVLVGLNMIDMAGNSDLRLEVDASDVDNEGFTWHLDTWDDSTLYAAGASWIALGFE